jgi:MFS superfamily sulfate permease-like transporter
VAGLTPRVAVVPTYDRRWLRGDVAAGVTVAALAVPKALGYATIAGVPVEEEVSDRSGVGPLAVVGALAFSGLALAGSPGHVCSISSVGCQSATELSGSAARSMVSCPAAG